MRHKLDFNKIFIRLYIVRVETERHGKTLVKHFH